MKLLVARSSRGVEGIGTEWDPHAGGGEEGEVRTLFEAHEGAGDEEKGTENG